MILSTDRAIELPPLRDRRGDIRPLRQYFLSKIYPEAEQRPMISPATAEVLASLPWIGNIRELRNAIEHAAIVSCGQTILPEHLPPAIEFPTARAVDGEAKVLVEKVSEDSAGLSDRLAQLVRTWTKNALLNPERSLPLHDQLLEQIESALIQEVLRATEGNVSLAAQILGIHRTTL